MEAQRQAIYGATGCSGQLISQQALASRLEFEVAGRDADRTRALADRLGVGARTFSLDDADGIRRGLEGVHCILHCAGPFSQTARQVMDACIERHIHYLDITAEFSVFALAESRSEAASAAGVMLLPGVGWDVVPSDCLAVHTARRVTQSTGVPDIEEFFQTGLTALATGGEPMTMPAGPTEEERGAGRSKVLVEVTDRERAVVRSLIDTPSGYAFTQLSAVEIARRVLGGEFTPGFQTPASAFGPELATRIGDTRIIDL